MSTVPAVTDETRPAEETVATAWLDDCHVARVVTVWLVPFGRTAVATNCARSPTGAGLPSIESATAEGGVDGWLGVDESEVAGSFA